NRDVYLQESARVCGRSRQGLLPDGRRCRPEDRQELAGFRSGGTPALRGVPGHAEGRIDRKVHLPEPAAGFRSRTASRETVRSGRDNRTGADVESGQGNLVRISKFEGVALVAASGSRERTGRWHLMAPHLVPSSFLGVEQRFVG